MCVRPLGSATIRGAAVLLRGDGVWLNGSMDPSMRLGSVYSTKKKKKSLLKSHPSQLLQKKSRRAMAAPRQVPEEEGLY